MTARTLIPAAAIAALCALPATAGAALPTGNLLKNPGAETSPVSGSVYFNTVPIPNWDTTASPTFRAIDAPPADDANVGNMVRRNQLPAGAGCRLFVGAPGPEEFDDNFPGYTSYSASQVVPVPAEAIGQPVTLSALLGAQENDPDQAHVWVFFLGAADNVIDSAYLTGPANDVNATPGTATNSTRFETKSLTANVPVGAVKMSVVLYSSAFAFGAGTQGELTNGYIDNVALTFDASAPPSPPAGCQPAGVTTGDASEIGQESAKISGVVEAHGEDTEWTFRVGKSPDVTDSTPSGSFGSTSSTEPQTVIGEATGLEPNTTYYYRLEASNAYGKDENRSRGAVKSFTTKPRPSSFTPPATFRPNPNYTFNTFAGAVTISKPKGGCVKKGTTFKVTVRDAAMGVRTIRRFIVQAGTGIGNDKQTNGPLGRPSGTVTVRKIPTKAPKNTRGSKMILRVIVDFNKVVDEHSLYDSADSVSGHKQFKFCKRKRR